MTLPLKKRRITVSINPNLYYQVFKDTEGNKSQIVERALETYYRLQLKKQVMTFCLTKDTSDLEDAELSLPAQLEVLNYD